MKEITDLNECKDMAKLFLHLEFQTVELGDMFVMHPFTMNPVYSDNRYNIVDMRNNKEAYNNFIQDCNQRIESVTKFKDFLCIIQKPYHFEFLKHTKNFISRADLGSYLKQAWVTNEYPNKEGGSFTKKQLLNLYTLCHKKDLMNSHELHTFDELPSSIKIYRGVTSYNETDIKKLSWTLSEDVAEWFAKRFHQKGKIYSTMINKKDVLAYFGDRSEQEVIVDFTKLKDLKLCKDFAENSLIASQNKSYIQTKKNIKRKDYRER